MHDYHIRIIHISAFNFNCSMFIFILSVNFPRMCYQSSNQKGLILPLKSERVDSRRRINERTQFGVEFQFFTALCVSSYWTYLFLQPHESQVTSLSSFMLPMKASFLLLVIRFMSYDFYGTISQQGSAWSIRNKQMFQKHRT